MRHILIALALVLAGGIWLVSQAGAEDAKSSAAIGQAAPAFSLSDQNGKTVSLSDYAGKIVVLEWFNNECPFVVKHYSTGHMNALATKYSASDVVWLAINSSKSTTNERNLAVAGEWKIDRSILNDATGEVGHAYGAKTTPHMYIVDKTGKLAYMGAIDSVKSTEAGDIDGAQNYVASALDELLAGKAVSTPETASYGCSVKYAR